MRDISSPRLAGFFLDNTFGQPKIMGGLRCGQNKDAADVVSQRDDFYWLGAIAVDRLRKQPCPQQ